MVGQVFGPDTELLKIDLRRLTFMDCAGLHVLVGAQSSVRATGASSRSPQVPRPNAWSK
jgi:anti-anti-sigma regulatory factor